MSLRVLALDGGGARGLVQAKYLIELEALLNRLSSTSKTSKRPIGSFFDLVVGTSIGGISALAISEGKDAKNVYNFINNCLDDVFSPTTFMNVRSWLRPKYRQTALAAALKIQFGDLTLANLGKNGPHVCVVSHSPSRRATRLLKSPYKEKYEALAENLSVVEVALATSAAPTYFPPASISHVTEKGLLLDGGLVANNPSVIALIEAAKIIDERLNGNDKHDAGVAGQIGSIKLISIGTGQVLWDADKDARGMASAGKLWWAKRFHDQVIEAQSSHAEYISQRLCSGDNYIRIDQQLKSKCYLDSVEGVRNTVETVHITDPQDRKVCNWFSPWERTL